MHVFLLTDHLRLESILSIRFNNNISILLEQEVANVIGLYHSYHSDNGGVFMTIVCYCNSNCLIINTILDIWFYNGTAAFNTWWIKLPQTSIKNSAVVVMNIFPRVKTIPLKERKTSQA